MKNRLLWVCFLAGGIIGANVCGQEQGDARGPARGGAREATHRRAARGPEREGRRGPPQEGIIQELLDDPAIVEEAAISHEQIESLRKGLAGSRTRLAELQEEMEAAALDQAALITEETIDEAALMAAIEKTGRIRTEIAKLRVKGLIVVRQTLTPEQIETVRRSAREKMRARMGERLREIRSWKDGAEARPPREDGPPPPPPPAADL